MHPPSQVWLRHIHRPRYFLPDVMAFPRRCIPADCAEAHILPLTPDECRVLILAGTLLEKEVLCVGGRGITAT